MIRPFLAAAFAFAFVVLGNVVSHRPPGALDLAAHDALAGAALPVAAFFTQSGRFPAYVAVCALALAFGFARRAWLVRAAASVAVLIVADVVSNLFKDHFMRARPPGQLVFFEPSYAYGSGHATLALTFYGGWALYASRSPDLPVPARVAIVAAAAAMIAAVCWSRLALSAHWLTDVIGGLLLGAAFVVLQDIAAGARDARDPANPFERYRP